MKIDDDDDDFVSVSEWARSKYKILKKHIGLWFVVVISYVQCKSWSAYEQRCD